MSITIRCPKCGADEDDIGTQQRVVLHGSLTSHVFSSNHPCYGKMGVRNNDSEDAGPVWVMCYRCGYRTKSLSVKTWTQEVNA